jgi:hypothetical protein
MNRTTAFPSLFLIAALQPMAFAEESDRDRAARRARESLASELRVEASSVTVASVEAAEWTEGSLGCGDATAGAAPAQATGWRVALTHGGKTYAVHVSGDRVVRCEAGGEPPSADARPGRETRGALLARIRADLAARLGIPAGETKLKSVERATFPDRSLGCPEPGRVYAQVVTEGQRFQLEAKGQTYRYHAAGDRFVTCEEAESR